MARGVQATSWVDQVRSCQAIINSIVEAAKNARLFIDECKGLSALTRQLLPFLEDLSDNVLDAPAATMAATGLQALESALQRLLAAVSPCATMGPFYALLNQEPVLSEFVNGATDLLGALQKLDAKQLKVDGYHVQSLGLLDSQLSKLAVSYTPCTTTSQMIVELRNEAEAVRTGYAQASSLPHSQLSLKYLEGCTVAQLSSDVAYLQGQLAAAQQGRKHVEAFFMGQLIAMEMPLLPADAKTAKAMASQVAVTRQPEVVEAAPRVDPLPLVQELLKTLTTPTLPLEQRAEALRPLVAAAGLDPEGLTDPNLHGGAVLFALTDPDCASKVVSLINEPTTEPLIKGWLLALVLSLVHPEQGLNHSTQAALINCGLPSALCRLVVRTQSPPEQRLQALTMLRVLVHDPATHPPMIEAKLLHALVQQIGDVKVIKGQIVSSARAPAASSPLKQNGSSAGAPTMTANGANYDLDQQNIELSVLMLADMAPGPFKADILSCGGVKALAQCVSDVSNTEQVRAAAAATLSLLMVDGAIAVEAARDDLLVGLVALSRSPTPAVQDAANSAIVQLLTPTPAMSADTAAAAAVSAKGAVVNLPPQGKASKLATRGSLGGAGSSSSLASTPSLSLPSAPSLRLASTPSLTAGSATGTGAGVGAVGGKSDEDLANELFGAMGKVLSPESTSALMDLLALDNPKLVPLALKFLPLTATNPACRAAIISHASGVPVLLREAGEKNNKGAIAALNRVASDNKLKAQCALVIAQSLAAAGGNVQLAANLAGALTAAGDVPPGSERDKPALVAAASFASEVLDAGGIPPLAMLIKSLDGRAKAKGTRALRMLAMYGDARVKDGIIKADALVSLVEATKITEGADAATGQTSVGQAASEALAGLSDNDAVRTAVFSSLLGYLGSTSTSGLACNACLIIAGASPGGYAALAKAGVLTPLVTLLTSADGDALLQPCQLLAGVAASSQEVAEQAVTAGTAPAVITALQKGSTAARTAAAAAAYYMMRASETARNQIVDRSGLGLITNAVKACPGTDFYFDDATCALATLATLHEGSRYEITRALKQSLKATAAVEQAAAAGVCCRLSYNPKGREIIASDDLVDPLVKVLAASGNPIGQKLAADALLHFASTTSVNVTPAPGSQDAASSISPKPLLVAKGCLESLQSMLKSTEEVVVCEASNCIECLCSGNEEGIKAAKRLRLQDSLHDVVQAGKRGEVGDKASKAAYAAYLKLL